MEVVANNYFGNEGRNQENGVTQQVNTAWTRLVIGESVQCQELKGERLIWVEYDPRNTIEALLLSVKDSLGICMDVALYLQGYYIQPQLKAAILMQTQDPVALMPSGQTKCAVGQEDKPLGVTVFNDNSPPRPTQHGSPAQIFETNKELISEGTKGNSGEVVMSKENAIDTSQTTSRAISPANTSVSSTKVLEEDLMMTIRVAPEAISPSVGPKKARGRGRKVSTEVVALDDKLPLENSSATNGNVPVRRSSRRIAKPTVVNEGGNASKRRGPRVDETNDENLSPQQAKRRKSSIEKEADNSGVAGFNDSPKSRRGKGKAVMNNMSGEINAMVEELLVGEEVELAASQGNPGDTGVDDVSDFRDKAVCDDPITEGSVIGQPEVSDKLMAPSSGSESAEDVNIITFYGSPMAENASGKLDGGVRNDDLAVAIQQTKGEKLITSADQIVPGNAIQADLLVAFEDGREVTVSNVWKVLATDGTNFSVVPPSAFIEGGVDICQAFTINFHHLIRPKFVEESQFQALVESLGLAGVDSFDMSLL